MGTTPTTVNTAAQTINNAIQTTIFGVALKALEAYAVAQLPFLSWPVISQIFNGLLNLAGSYLYTYLSQMVTFEVIEMQTAAETTAYQNALIALQNAYNLGDTAGVTTATTNVRTALASLIHWDGTASIKFKAKLRFDKRNSL